MDMIDNLIWQDNCRRSLESLYDDETVWMDKLSTTHEKKRLEAIYEGKKRMLNIIG